MDSTADRDVVLVIFFGWEAWCASKRGELSSVLGHGIQSNLFKNGGKRHTSVATR